MLIPLKAARGDKLVNRTFEGREQLAPHADVSRDNLEIDRSVGISGIDPLGDRIADLVDVVEPAALHPAGHLRAEVETPDVDTDPLEVDLEIIRAGISLRDVRIDRQRSLHASTERPADAIEEKCKVIIAGHGRVGGIVNRMLRGSGFETTVIDYSASTLEMLRAYNVKVYYGDATRPDLLHAAGIEEADLMVITIDDKEHITELTRYVVAHYPHVHVIARAVDRHHVYDLWAAGCRDIIRETFDSSLRVGRSALIAMGASSERAQQISSEFEMVDRRYMREMAGLYNPDIPSHENPAYVAKVKELSEEWARQMRKTTKDTPPR